MDYDETAKKCCEEFENDMTAEELQELKKWITKERKRLKEEEALFDKKLQILQNGYANLDMDRKRFEKEKQEFEQNKHRRNEWREHSFEDRSYNCHCCGYGDVGAFFAGVNGPLALRKRYKDLLKIFHPDNRDGDEGIVKAINKEYERLRKEDIC